MSIATERNPVSNKKTQMVFSLHNRFPAIIGCPSKPAKLSAGYSLQPRILLPI